jgi:hypothetical protein
LEQQKYRFQQEDFFVARRQALNEKKRTGEHTVQPPSLGSLGTIKRRRKMMILRQSLWLLAASSFGWPTADAAATTTTAFVATRTTTPSPPQLSTMNTLRMVADIRSQNRVATADVKSDTKHHVSSPPSSSSLGWMPQALREMALSWEGKLMPQLAPPESSPNHHHIFRHLAAQQLAATERQLQELQQEYKEYRQEMTQRLEQQIGYSDLAGALQKDEYNNDHDPKEAVIVDLQAQLKHQVDVLHKKSAQAAHLDRELNEERRTVERLRHAIHDYQSRFNERQHEMENTIAQLEKRHVVTSVALQQAQDLVVRREKQIAILESSSSSLRKLCGRMQQILVQRTRHRLDRIKSRLFHPFSPRRRQQQRQRSRSSTTDKENNNNGSSVIAKIKMIVQRRRHRRRHSSSSSSSQSRTDTTSLVVSSRKVSRQSGKNDTNSKSSINRHPTTTRSADLALCRMKM